MRSHLRTLATVGLAGGLCAVGYVLADDTRRENAQRTLQGLRRISRAVSFGIVATLRDAELKARSLKVDDPEFIRRKIAVDKRNAEDFLQLCLRNGGGFLKMAQYLSVQNHALPVEWTSILSKAQDQARPVSFSSIAKVFFDDTGRRPEDVFASIEEQPVAAASLAQVHRAVTRDGRIVAVKIQYPHMQETFLQVRLFNHLNL
jgi:aarF domain-containing kinase